MMMTAAGTVPAAKVLVIGAGVAGIQAIATAKRLGAIVSAPDVWDSASTEEVTTSQLADGMFGDWGLALLGLGLLMAMAMIGAAYLVRDERIENLEWEYKGGDVE